MKRLPSFASSAVLGLLAVSLAPHAAASMSFPEPLRNKLGLAELPYPPLGCQLCHADDQGGIGTATKPFGRSMRKAGTVGGSVPSMLAALNNIEADGTDSDHDGVPDIAELRAGTDPNVFMSTTGMAPPPEEEIPLPETGCALAQRRGSSFIGTMLLLSAALSFAVRRRRSK